MALACCHAHRWCEEQRPVGKHAGRSPPCSMELAWLLLAPGTPEQWPSPRQEAVS